MSPSLWDSSPIGKGASLKFTIVLSSPIAIVPNSFVAKESSGNSYCFSTPPLFKKCGKVAICTLFNFF
jgi:hypothetical protein